jgi:hypothetical protein
MHQLVYFQGTETETETDGSSDMDGDDAAAAGHRTVAPMGIMPTQLATFTVAKRAAEDDRKGGPVQLWLDTTSWTGGASLFEETSMA